MQFQPELSPETVLTEPSSYIWHPKFRTFSPSAVCSLFALLSLVLLLSLLLPPQPVMEVISITAAKNTDKFFFIARYSPFLFFIHKITRFVAEKK